MRLGIGKQPGIWKQPLRIENGKQPIEIGKQPLGIAFLNECLLHFYNVNFNAATLDKRL